LLQRQKIMYALEKTTAVIMRFFSNVLCKYKVKTLLIREPS